MTEQKKKMDLIKEGKSLAFIIFIALLIRTLVIEPFFIPSSSMNNTLREGDYIFSTKYSYGYSKHSLLFFTPDSLPGRILASEPKRGDIVIFRPPHAMHMRYIKRLIGMPGDKIQLRNSIVYINDEPLKREYLADLKNSDGWSSKQYKETLPNDVEYKILQVIDSGNKSIAKFNNTPVFNVPEGQYFFMGDNRDNSNDSRADLGFVPFENFIAKAQFIFFSQGEYLWLFDSGIKEQIAQVYYWLKSVRGHRIFKSVYSE
jgi:signal peptidase I